MPIRPQFRFLYPIDWPQLSAVIRFRRAKGRCEACGRPHGREVKHLGEGTWFCDERSQWISGRGRPRPSLTGRDFPAAMTTKVFLATAHLNHDPSDSEDRNLKALCQRCHMLHDRDEHRRQRQQTFRQRRALGDLFSGRYWF